jgi:hypothetical protein
MRTNRPGMQRRYRTAWPMSAFDKLPVETREALANAVDNWGKTVPISPALIAAWNAIELARREYDRAHALGVYAGNAPDTRPADKARGVRSSQLVGGMTVGTLRAHLLLGNSWACEA